MELHYHLLSKMGLISPSVDTQCSTYPRPTYIGWYSSCDNHRSTKPSCAHNITTLTEQELALHLTEFTTLYPQFTSTPLLITKAKQLACMYPQYSCVDNPCNTHKFYLLLAHYLITDDTEYQQNVISSASVGSSSISYNTGYTDKLATNPFYYWLSKSKPGNHLLTIITQSTGVVVV